MINDLFEGKEKERRKRILLMDFSAISNATFSICLRDPDVESQEDLIGIWRHTLLNSILVRKGKIQPDEVVLGLDHGTWRTEFFEYYKARRKLNKVESDIDYEFFYESSDKFVEEIRTTFPWLVISEKKTEGDDILAILAKELSIENDIVLLTSDKDLKQLLKIPNVRYYSYRNDCYETVPNPHEFLLRQILGGDTGDDIPNVKSQDNSFVAGIRQKNCGPVGIDKILEQGIDEFLEETGLQKNYERNKKMIELSEQTIPEDKWKNVVNKYHSYKRNKPDFMIIAQFLHKHKLKKLQDKINEFF